MQRTIADVGSSVSDGLALRLQDWLDIDFAIKEQVDFIAVSFVKTSDVINNLKSYVESRSARVSSCMPSSNHLNLAHPSWGSHPPARTASALQ